MVKTAETVVIGGGAVGTAITYFLAKNGVNVALLEKAGIAADTSGCCDGNVMLNDTMPGYDCQLKKLSQDMFPVLAEDIAGGLEMACDGAINPMAMAQGLAHGASKLGADILTHTAARAIKQDTQGQIQRVVTDKGDILTHRIVNAAGIWAKDVGQMVGLDLPIEPRQGQLLVGERTFPLGKRKLQEFGYMMSKFERTDYQRSLTPEMEKHGVAFVFEPTEAGTFLIGSSRWFAGRSIDNTVEVLRCIAQQAKRFLPVLKDVKFILRF